MYQNLIFPPDSNVVATSTHIGCTTEVNDNECPVSDSAWQTILDNFDGTILYANLSSSGNNDPQIRCKSPLDTSNNFILRSHGSSNSAFLVYYCKGDVDYSYYYSLTQGRVFAELVYVDYDINMTDISTSTPYTSYRGVVDGIEYSYNPILAQIGIFSFAILFLLFLYFIIKLLRKW